MTRSGMCTFLWSVLLPDLKPMSNSVLGHFQVECKSSTHRVSHNVLVCSVQREISDLRLEKSIDVQFVTVNSVIILVSNRIDTNDNSFDIWDFIVKTIASSPFKHWTHYKSIFPWYNGNLFTILWCLIL